MFKGLLLSKRNKEIAKRLIILYTERYKQKDNLKTRIADDKEIVAAAIYLSCLKERKVISQKTIAKHFGMTHYRFVNVFSAMMEKLHALSAEEVLEEIERSGESPYLESLMFIKSSVLGKVGD